MPELPEVETVVRGLRRVAKGRTFGRIKSQAPPSSIVVGKSFGRKRFESILVDRTIEQIDRRGKNILISLSGDITLWVHLKMTGRFLWVPKDLPRHKHDLVTIEFQSNGSYTPAMQLRFNDYRRFGRLRLYENHELWEQKGLKELGPEPLEINPEDFIALCLRRPRMIKPALLDQSFVAGIGNIYADESLHLARIHPQQLTSAISRKKLRTLHTHMQQLLRKAIRLLGTSVITYAGVDGKPGSFQNHLQVYGREGDPCGFCRSSIVRKKIGSRSAHFCPRCQRVSQ